MSRLAAMGQWRALVAPVLVFGAALAAMPACSGAPGSASSTPGLVPVIESIVSGQQAADGSVPLTADGHSPRGGALTYHWSASNGVLSSLTGTSVTWKPTTAEGKTVPGAATITVIATSGNYSATAQLALNVGNDGVVSQSGGIPIYIPRGGTVVSAAPTTPVSAAPAASGATTAASPGGCQVLDVVPTWAAPGSVAYVRGAGFGVTPAVTLGDRHPAVLGTSANAITFGVPSDLIVAGTSIDVSVPNCNGQTVKAGDLTASGDNDFGPAVATPGQGLLGTVGNLADGADAVPDLSSMNVLGSILVPNLDLAPQAVQSGLPAPGGPLTSNFAIRFSGHLNVTAAGSTHFSLYATDGAKLYLDGKLVADDEPSAASSAGDADVDLTAGPHAVRVDYYHGDGGSIGLQLLWRPAGASTLDPIPATALSPL